MPFPCCSFRGNNYFPIIFLLGPRRPRVGIIFELPGPRAGNLYFFSSWVLLVTTYLKKRQRSQQVATPSATSAKSHRVTLVVVWTVEGTLLLLNHTRQTIGPIVLHPPGLFLLWLDNARTTSSMPKQYTCSRSNLNRNAGGLCWWCQSGLCAFLGMQWSLTKIFTVEARIWPPRN